MENIKQLIQKINDDYKFAKENNLDLEIAHWGYEEGILLPCNGAKALADSIAELREVLQALFDTQNGPPLATPRAKMDWLIAYTNAGEILKKYEQ